jgi:hypothetical protein
MNCKHPAAARFLNNGLFDDLITFAEIEARISALPTTKEISDAFEVFAEAYLSTQKIAQAAEVWPFDAIPMDQRETLARDTRRDMGVDEASARLEAGEVFSYQVMYVNHTQIDLRESEAINIHEKSLKNPMFSTLLREAGC